MNGPISRLARTTPRNFGSLGPAHAAYGGSAPGFADGGPITIAPITPQAASRPISPYSIRGIASAVGGAYDAARGATTNGFEALQHTFGRPPGYEPAPVNQPMAPAPMIGQVAAPAPQPAPLPQLGGVNLNALQRREAAAGLADGGPVRGKGPISALAAQRISGPGSGVSDSIPRKMRVGSFVMPADSARALAKGNVPVRVSDGEFEFTPEAVHALGATVLSLVRDATHRPVRSRRGPGGRAFADGGTIDVTKDPATGTTSFSGGNVSGAPTYSGGSGFQASGAGGPTGGANVIPAGPVAASSGGAGAAPAAMGSNTGPSAAAAGAPTLYEQELAKRNLETTASSIMPSKERDAARAALQPAAAPAATGSAAAAGGAPAPTARPAAGGSQYEQDLARRNLETTASSIVPSQERDAARAQLGQTQPVAPARTPARSYADGGQVDNNVRAVLPPPIGSQAAAQIPTGGDRPVSMVDQIPTGGDRIPAPAGPISAMAGAGPAFAGRGSPDPVPTYAPASAPTAPGPITSMVVGAPGVTKAALPGLPTTYTNDPSSIPLMQAPAAPISEQNMQAADALAARSRALALASVGGNSSGGGYPLAPGYGPSAAAGYLPAGYGVTIPADTGGFGILDKGYQDARAAAMDRASDAQAADSMGRQGAEILSINARNQGEQLLENLRQSGAMARTGVEQGGAMDRAQAQIAANQQLHGPLLAAQTQEAQQHVTQGQAALDAQAAYQKALATGDPKQIDAAELALRGVSGHLPLRYETGQGGSMGADATHNIAIQYLNGDHSVLSALGSGTIGAMNRSAVMQQVAEEMKNRGYAPEQVNAMRLNFLGDQAGSTVAGKRTTQIDIAAGEAGNALQLVRQYSANVPRTQFQPLNKALSAYRTNTGDPATVQLGAAMNTLVNAYSRAISPTGTPTVSDKQHAEALLNSAQTPEQTEGVLKVMEAEIGAARNATAHVREGIVARAGAGAGQASAPAAGAAGAPAAAVLTELRRRAANDPALAQRLQQMGY